MNCTRAFDIDLEDLLVDPESAEFRDFEAHSASCPDCAGELALHRGLLARLKGEEIEQREHPADALLLRLARNPDALPEAERTSLRAHLRDCAPCDDAYRATLMLVPEPQRSLLARVGEVLRSWLVPSALPAWAPVAAVLALLVGVTLQLDPLGLGGPEPDLRFRSIPSAFATQLELAVGERSSLSLYGLAEDDVVILRVELPEALRGTEVRATIATEGGMPVFEGRVGWDPDADLGGFLDLRAGAFERDSYRIELVSASGARHSFWLDVR